MSIFGFNLVQEVLSQSLFTRHSDVLALLGEVLVLIVLSVFSVGLPDRLFLFAHKFGISRSK